MKTIALTFSLFATIFAAGNVAHAACRPLNESLRALYSAQADIEGEMAETTDGRLWSVPLVDQTLRRISSELGTASGVVNCGAALKELIFAQKGLEDEVRDSASWTTYSASAVAQALDKADKRVIAAVQAEQSNYHASCE